MNSKARQLNTRVYNLLLIFCISPIMGFAQVRTLYLNPCEQFSEKKGVIRREIRSHPEQKFTYEFTDYYDNGSVVTTGISKSSNGKIRYGDFTFYYPNGNKLAIVKFESASLTDQRVYFDSTGAPSTVEKVLEFMPTTTFTIDNVTYRGKCLCYKMEGEWEEENTKSGEVEVVTYNKGERMEVMGISKADEQPRFRAGQDRLYEYLVSKMGYPFISRILGREGKVYAQFVVDKQGNVRNVKVLHSLDKPTKRVIEDALQSTSGMWIPGRYKGEVVASVLTLPVIFELKK